MSDALVTLLELSRRLRQAESSAELAFMAVNDLHALVPFRQGALWFASGGLRALSGVVQPEANAPYAQWLERVCRQLAVSAGLRAVVAGDLAADEAAEWAEWLPAHALWLGLPDEQAGDAACGGLLLARELPWTEQEQALLSEWFDAWRHAWAAIAPRKRWTRLTAGAVNAAGVSRWRRARWALLAAALATVLALPIRLTVLAPGELVPAQPVLVRAPLDGVIEHFAVEPNQLVDKDQPLFGFDEALIRSRLTVARQTLAVAEAEFRQATQQALGDSRAKAQLGPLTGKIDERRTEVAYLDSELQRARIVAPRAGIVLADDPSEWIGRPVTVGERILRIATPGDVEVESWVPVGDAIPLPRDARLRLHLNASPLAPVVAQVRYIAHEAAQRPDGSYAYRVRATLTEPTDHRVGLKGTARLEGERVPLIYWLLRRPLATLRTTVGW